MRRESFIELNADMGESFGVYRYGRDDEVMSYVDSVNIACGFHGGDPVIIRESVNAALARGIRIGAHIGFNDREGFGRRRIEISPSQAYAMALYQIGALNAFITVAGGRMQHVKPHGALYMMATEDRCLADALVQASYDIDPRLAIYGLPDSQLLVAAGSKGMKTVPEYFADRPYQGTEVQMFGWTYEQIGNPDEIAERVRTMRRNPEFAAVQTVCVHSDTHGSPDIARSVKAALTV